jgi:2-keto-4-pentenoate hydratase
MGYSHFSGGRFFGMSADPHEASLAAVEGIVSRFRDARTSGVALASYPGDVPADLAVAYRCQDAAIDGWSDELVGWKVARIAPAWAAKFPEERLIGPVFRNNVRLPRVGEIPQCPVFDGGFAAVEAELVIRVGADAPARKLDWSSDEASELVADLCIGIEVASSPLATLNDLGPGAVISDFGNNWGVVVGASVRDWRNVVEIPVTSYVDRTMVGQGRAAIRQGALGALAFTLSKAARRGRPLRAGAIISTGMITGVHDIRAGQRSRHVFESYGEVAACAVRAQPLARSS